MRRTLNAINLSTSDVERVVRRELERAGGGTVIIRNVSTAASAERIARLAMANGWDVGCSKKDKYFLVTLSKGIFDRKQRLKSASGFAN